MVRTHSSRRPARAAAVTVGLRGSGDGATPTGRGTSFRVHARRLHDSLSAGNVQQAGLSGPSLPHAGSGSDLLLFLLLGLGLLTATGMSTAAVRRRMPHQRDGVVALAGTGIVGATLAALRRHEPDELRVASAPVAVVPPSTEEISSQTVDERTAVLEEADEAGDADAAFALGGLLVAHGDLEGAIAALRRADKRGHAAAASNLGVLLEYRGQVDGALAAYRRADRRGDAGGAFNLGVLLAERGSLTGAAPALHRAAQRGDHAAASKLGVVLEQQGDLDGALEAYRRADEGGDAKGSLNLGRLLADQGEHRGAREGYERAVERGDPDVQDRARAALAELGGDQES